MTKPETDVGFRPTFGKKPDRSRCLGALLRRLAGAVVVGFVSLPTTAHAVDSEFVVERPVRFIEIRPSPKHLAIEEEAFRFSVSDATVAQDPKLRSREIVQPLTLEATPIEGLPATARYDFEMRWRDEFRPGQFDWERFWGVQHRFSLTLKPSDFAMLESAIENRTRFNVDGQADQALRGEGAIMLRHPGGHSSRLSAGMAGFTDFVGNRRGERFVRLQIEQKIFQLPIRLRITPAVVQEIPRWDNDSALLRHEIENALVWDLTQKISLTSGVLVQQFEAAAGAERSERQQLFARVEQWLTPTVSVRWVSSYEQMDNGSPQPTTRVQCGVEAGWTLTERIRGALQVLRSEALQSPNPRDRVPQVLLSVSMAGSF